MNSTNRTPQYAEEISREKLLEVVNLLPTLFALPITKDLFDQSNYLIIKDTALKYTIKRLSPSQKFFLKQELGISRIVNKGPYRIDLNIYNQKKTFYAELAKGNVRDEVKELFTAIDNGDVLAGHYGERYSLSATKNLSFSEFKETYLIPLTLSNITAEPGAYTLLVNSAEFDLARKKYKAYLENKAANANNRDQTTNKLNSNLPQVKITTTSNSTTTPNNTTTPNHQVKKLKFTFPSLIAHEKILAVKDFARNILKKFNPQKTVQKTINIILDIESTAKLNLLTREQLTALNYELGVIKKDKYTKDGTQLELFCDKEHFQERLNAYTRRQSGQQELSDELIQFFDKFHSENLITTNKNYRIQLSNEDYQFLKSDEQQYHLKEFFTSANIKREHDTYVIAIEKKQYEKVLKIYLADKERIKRAKNVAPTECVIQPTNISNATPTTVPVPSPSVVNTTSNIDLFRTLPPLTTTNQVLTSLVTKIPQPNQSIPLSPAPSIMEPVISNQPPLPVFFNRKRLGDEIQDEQRKHIRKNN